MEVSVPNEGRERQCHDRPNVPASLGFGAYVINGKMRHTSVILPLSFAFALLLPACTRHDSGKAVLDARTLRVQVSGEPVSLNPALVEDLFGYEILANTMDGLVGYDGAGNLEDRLAVSHELSADGRSYRFKLRPGIRWSDGRPVEAAQIIEGFRRALQPGSTSKHALLLEPIRGATDVLKGKAPPEALGVRAEGPETIVVELAYPAPYLIHVLALPIADPARPGESWSVTGPTTGAYRITESAHERKTVLEKNPAYWRENKGPDRVELITVREDATALNLLLEGKVDLLMKVPPLDVPLLREKSLFRSGPFLATYFLILNTKSPPFNDRLYRRAFAGAINKVEVAQAMGAGEEAARTFLSPGLEGSEPYSLKNPFADAVAAVKKRPPLKVPVTASFDTSSRNSMVMEKIQSDVRKAIGMEIELRNLDWKTHIKTMATEPASISRFGWVAPFKDPMTHLEAFKTGNPNNYGHWSNATYDRLVEEVKRLPSGPARESKIKEAQRILVEDEAAIVPIFHYVIAHAVAPRVSGYRVNPFGVVIFSDLGLKAPEAVK